MRVLLMAVLLHIPQMFEALRVHHVLHKARVVRLDKAAQGIQRYNAALQLVCARLCGSKPAQEVA